MGLVLTPWPLRSGRWLFDLGQEDLRVLPGTRLGPYEIVAIHDVSAHEGAPYIVTALLEGEARFRLLMERAEVERENLRA